MWDSPLYSTTKVTIELRDIIDNSVDLWKDTIHFLSPGFGNLVVHANEERLRRIIEDHFYFRQIGFETVGRFLHEFRTRVNIIAPHYQNITQAQALLLTAKDPLESYHLTETFTETNTGTSTGTSTGNGSSEVTAEGTTTDSETGSKNITGSVTDTKKHRFSDTPQGVIDNINTHLTNASIDDNTSSNTDDETTSRQGNGSTTSESKTTDTSTATSQASAESTVTRTLERFGNIGVQPLGDEVKKYREAFINITEMIINDLEPLFLRVY